jgi:serine/threonine protein kinase
MPATVNLEGSEEDFAQLLVFHRIVNNDQLQRALEERQSHAARGGPLEPLRDTLLRLKLVSSALLFDALRAASKVVETCTKCNALHHIHYYHPGSRYFCQYCKGPLRVTDPGQSLKWQPGELARSVNEINAPPSADTAVRAASTARAAQPPPNPLDDPSVMLSAGDETMLDMSVAKRVAAVPQPPPPPPVESVPPDRSVTIVPGGDETMLDMGDTPRSTSRPPAFKPPTAPPPVPHKPGGDPQGLPSWMDDESALDMGSIPRTPPKFSPTPSALPKLPQEGEAAPTERSITMTPGGGETMLDMGDTPRTSSKPPAVNASEEKPVQQPVDLGATIIPTPGAGETMLDMGPLSGNTPPKRQVGDMTTSVFPGSRKPLPGGMPRTPPETPVLPKGSTMDPSYDVTTRRGTKTGPTILVTPSQGGSSTVDKTHVQATTPKSGSGGSSAAISNQKALPPEVAQAAKDVNRVFGKYVLMNELGRGGAGVVYKAWDTLILQYVAIKFIRNQDDTEGDTSSGSSQIEEFQREARMSVRLRHPNIVRIYELGCMSNRYYLSMEYIEGGTLLAMIHGGKERNQKTRFNSDPLKFIRIMQNIAMAVDYAHNTKPPIIHRDLKPHNVLVDLKGNPYVVDFGLAKEVDTGEGATLTGVVKGTPTYMAPEQAEGRNRDVDVRTDVYSLGAILYEILTGRPPYLGESVPEILRKIATELPERPNDAIAKAALSENASSTANSKTKTKPLLVPKPLETICLKALEKGKADRYQTAKELAEDIERYLKDEDILAQEPGLWRRCRRKVRQHPIISGALAAVLLAGLSVGIALKTLRQPVDTSKQDLITGIVARGTDALKAADWPGLKAEADNLSRQDSLHPKIAEFKKALDNHEILVQKTRREWNSDLDRLKREPLSKVLGGLREKFHRCPELKPEFRDGLRLELAGLQARVLDDSRRLVGAGARPAWVEEIIKQNARESKEQAEMLLGLAKDPDFVHPAEQLVVEAREGLSRVIAYQGTWTLQVNVAPFAEVTVTRAEKELANDFTPVGLQELEVVGSSYVVELCWPSRENAKVRLKEEIVDLRHGQTVVIRGDIASSKLKQERK